MADVPYLYKLLQYDALRALKNPEVLSALRRKVFSVKPGEGIILPDSQYFKVTADVHGPRADKTCKEGILSTLDPLEFSPNSSIGIVQDVAIPIAPPKVVLCPD